MAKVETIYYYGQFSRPGDCENWIVTAFNRNGYYCYRIDKDCVDFDAFYLTVIRNKPDAVLFTKIPEVPLAKFENFVRAYKGLILWYTFDWMKHECNKWYWPMAKLSDICFQTDGYKEQEEYTKAGINRHELHQAADIQHDLPKTITNEDIERFSADVSFAGSLYTDRRREINKLLSNVNLNYKYYGNTSLRSGGGEEVWGEDFAKMCYLSKIVIGDNFTNDIDGYWSDRVYLTLGCGGFFLTSYVKGLENVFINGGHLAWYNDLNDMMEKIKYFLPREGLRKVVATQGYKYVRACHTFDNRIQRITEVIKQYEKK